MPRTSELRPSLSVTSAGETAKALTTTTAGRGSIWPPVSIWLWVEVQALTNASPRRAIAPSADLAAPDLAGLPLRRGCRPALGGCA